MLPVHWANTNISPLQPSCSSLPGTFFVRSTSTFGCGVFFFKPSPYDETHHQLLPPAWTPHDPCCDHLSLRPTRRYARGRCRSPRRQGWVPLREEDSLSFDEMDGNVLRHAFSASVARRGPCWQYWMRVGGCVSDASYGSGAEVRIDGARCLAVFPVYVYVHIDLRIHLSYLPIPRVSWTGHRRPSATAASESPCTRPPSRPIPLKPPLPASPRRAGAQ
ncbi:hypothetical protein C8R45DRAFT_558083 [Mycena sanguinolenta]|nr:hypothetical protein C8R45DRAFT_558083 [Mycena sanguinolenta]